MAKPYSRDLRERIGACPQKSCSTFSIMALSVPVWSSRGIGKAGIGASANHCQAAENHASPPLQRPVESEINAAGMKPSEALD
jgi:hypothetical protein